MVADRFLLPGLHPARSFGFLRQRVVCSVSRRTRREKFRMSAHRLLASFCGHH